VELREGTTCQYAWVDNGRFPDGSPNPNVRDPLYHVRAAVRPENVLRVSKDAEDNILVEFRRGKEPTSEPPLPLPPDVAFVDTAYSLDTGLGFVEYVDAGGQLLRKLPNRIVLTENLTQRTVGSYPRIRLRSARDEVGGLVISGTACVIVGTPRDESG
jgi:hypothetical protein